MYGYDATGDDIKVEINPEANTHVNELKLVIYNKSKEIVDIKYVDKEIDLVKNEKFKTTFDDADDSILSVYEMKLYYR